MADSSTQRLIRELFDGASAIPEPERRAWVERRANGNMEVISNVLRLLHASNQSGSAFMAEPLVKRPKPPLNEGMNIGPYRILKEIDTGGMGVVYLAMRSDGLHKGLVAVKVIRPEIMSESIRVRFVRECEILGRLSHPGITRILDGGTTPTGLPYSVMEYIDGKPLDVFCKENRTPLQQRLNLFRATCDAVQYMHENNVLHRDLKPANILVTHTGQVKLLDFGISKLTGEFATTVTTKTAIMTPPYASPEQIQSQPLGPTSDIYSLGVILYELLTGVRPLKFDGLGLSQVIDTVKTTIPPKPSTQQPLPEDADPGRLLASMRHQLAGDLDCILLMSLRKEPARRYPSAKEFAADIERFQNRRPVLARADSASYLVGKTLRRNRLRIAALLLIGLSIAGGGTAYYLSQRVDSEASEITDLERQKDKLIQQVKDLQRKAETNAGKALKAQQLGEEPAQQRYNHARIGVEDFASDYQAEVPGVLQQNDPELQSNVRDLTQKSLSYFSDIQSVAGDDPGTVAALGRAYQAVAKSQWSPAGTPSLNDPAQAQQTYEQAYKVLKASPSLQNNPQVRQVLAQILSDPSMQQLKQALEAAGIKQ
jgi:serine/threonine protein kinase